jgi:hypothetical protein
MTTDIADKKITLAECEKVIERGLVTFVEVGEALLTIRYEKLYIQTHKTFEEYCRERWGMSKTHANRQIEAATIAGKLAPIGVTPPNESVARELAPLKDDPEKMAAALQEAKEQAPSGTPTAKQVGEVVSKRVKRPSLRLVGARRGRPDPVTEWSVNRRTYKGQVTGSRDLLSRFLRGEKVSRQQIERVLTKDELDPLLREIKDTHLGLEEFAKRVQEGR